MPSPGGGFELADWAVLLAYLGLVAALGAVCGRRRRAGEEDFFLASRGMPMWAVSVSVLATSLSAATFVGGPQQAYASDLTYLSSNIGGLLAAAIVAAVFIPVFYRYRVTSVYEYLGRRLGPRSRTSASGMFLIGRVFASGARLFIVSIPFAMVAFGDTSPGMLIVSIVIISTVAAAYTAFGGIRAVIWTDVLQAAVVIGTVGVAWLLLLDKIPHGIPEIVDTLRRGDDGGDKLRIIDLSLDPSRPFTLWTALIGFTLFNVAAFGTDQDLTQRMLTCKNARSGAWSVIVAHVIGLPVVLLFLGMGLLLHVYYQQPDFMAAAAPGYAIDDSRKVFLQFMLAEMPIGLRGLMMAGLFAAAMSSMDSALNAMASSAVVDFYRPRRARRDPATAAARAAELRVSRIAILVAALALASFATVCVFWQRASGETLINFALGVMVFAYAGLLGVFATALLTRRGNDRSAVAALISGFVAVFCLGDPVYGWIAPRLGLETTLAFPWKMTLATLVSVAVCSLGGAAKMKKPGKLNAKGE